MAGMSLTRDQKRVETEIAHATARMGKKFITLRLLDITKNRIQGAMVLHGTPYIDHQTNMKQYHFEERGGPINFTEDEMRGGMFCKILDCDHNRRFLASHHGLRFWEIEDDAVQAEIAELAAGITKRAIIASPQAPKETKMSDTELETEMARLQAEASRRKIERADAGRRRPEAVPKPEVNIEPAVAGPEPVGDEGDAVDSEVPENSEPRTRGRRANRSKSNLVSMGG